MLLRSYVLVRPQGNLVVYNSPGVSEAAGAIRALGAPARLLVNHGHEPMYGRPDLDVPIWVHREDCSEWWRPSRWRAPPSGGSSTTTSR